jgi:hypothetical protein
MPGSQSQSQTTDEEPTTPEEPLAAYRTAGETAIRPGFRALPTEGDDGWTDASGAAAASGSGSEDGWEPGDGTVPGPTAEATTTETTGLSRASIAKRVAPLIVRVLGMVALAVHGWRTPGDDNAVWIYPAELTDISEPLGRIASRRIPARLAGSGDVIDGLDAALATTAYVERGFMEEAQYKAERGFVQGPVPESEGMPAAEPAPPSSPIDVLRPV